MQNEILTVDEASRAIRVCKATFYAMLNRRDILGFKVGRKTFITRSEIQHYLASVPKYRVAA